MATIVLPKSTAELLQLGQKIIHKHKDLSEQRVELSNLIGFHVENLEQKLAEAKPKFEDMCRLKELYEQLNTQIKMACGTHGSDRKISPGTIKFFIAQIRDILKGIHKEDLKQLSDWGFEVIERE
ncbi:MAG: hypothetical protein PSX36_10965 [bacterium]|nr:hypothetical protein [bacterium]